MLTYRNLSALLLVLYCSLRGNASVSPEVIELQRGLYGELQALERAALVTSNEDTISDSSVFGELRGVFYEFERQNQESITAILRVLALVDHTLENTIKDCAKIFDLSSLESENILFQHVTRPLLLRIAQLCAQISEEENLAGLEDTMEAIEKEANDYRKRLDEAKMDMQTVLEQLETFPKATALAKVLEKPINFLGQRVISIEGNIMESLQNISDRQRTMRSSVLEAVSSSDDVAMLSTFMDGLENDTDFLASDLFEQVQLWYN